MYRFHLNTIATQLIFGNNDLPKKEALAHAFTMVEHIVEVFNLGCVPEVAYDRIDYLQSCLNNNVAIEDCFLKELNNFKDYTVKCGWDVRLRARLVSAEFKHLNFVNVGMDLDATIFEQNNKAEDPTPLSELIDDNPTAEDISKIQERIAAEQEGRNRPNPVKRNLNLAVPVEKSHLVYF